MCFLGQLVSNSETSDSWFPESLPYLIPAFPLGRPEASICSLPEPLCLSSPSSQ